MYTKVINYIESCSYPNSWVCSSPNTIHYHCLPLQLPPLPPDPSLAKTDPLLDPLKPDTLPIHLGPGLLTGSLLPSTVGTPPVHNHLTHPSLSARVRVLDNWVGTLLALQDGEERQVADGGLSLSLEAPQVKVLGQLNWSSLGSDCQGDTLMSDVVEVGQVAH